MKKIVICTSSTTIGGMEVMFSNYIRFLIQRDFEVYLFTEEDPSNIYYNLLSDLEDRIKYIKRNTFNVMYLTVKEQEEFRSSILGQFGQTSFDTLYCACGYFTDLMLLLIVFRGKNVKITMIWPHPQNWLNHLYLAKNTYHLQRRPYLSLYYRQKKLLELMHCHHAFYYTSYSIFYFNKWYYSAQLTDWEIEGLPVQVNSGLEFKYEGHREEKWNILWVGRFDFNKIDAICKIHKTLEKIASEKRIKIKFNIVGHGNIEYEEFLKKSLVSKNVEVSFLGTIKPNELNDVFNANDIGIAMGVTVKQMGYVGLPAILIDSMSKYYTKEKCCNWVFDIETGDDGDGMYYEKAGILMNRRESLYDVLLKVIEQPRLLREYSDKCRDYVHRYYSYERQYDIITKRILNSSFTAELADPIVYGWYRRLLRKMYRLLK